VAKPFSGKVLAARVRRLLRRHVEEAGEKNVVRVEGVEIDPARREVRIDGEPVTMTLTEFNILHTLARRRGTVFTRYQIVDTIHGETIWLQTGRWMSDVA
jgi:DNA-binding response OmpR family regulator